MLGRLHGEVEGFSKAVAEIPHTADEGQLDNLARREVLLERLEAAVVAVSGQVGDRFCPANGRLVPLVKERTVTPGVALQVVDLLV
ncbi:MAG: hypothetical protein IT307_11010 [Chloroflexi bacterium]|nr:hypothetical protein [Chloroflexota bacterium]